MSSVLQKSGFLILIVREKTYWNRLAVTLKLFDNAYVDCIYNTVKVKWKCCNHVLHLNVCVYERQGENEKFIWYYCLHMGILFSSRQSINCEGQTTFHYSKGVSFVPSKDKIKTTWLKHHNQLYFPSLELAILCSIKWNECCDKLSKRGLIYRQKKS